MARTCCSESRGLSRLRPCGRGRGMPAWSHSVGRQSHSRRWPPGAALGGCSRTGRALTVCPGNSKKPQPKFQQGLQTLHLWDRQALSLAQRRQRGPCCRQGSAPCQTCHTWVPQHPQFPPDPAPKVMWNPRLPLASLAQPLTSTGPTFDATCVTRSLEDKIRVRASHRDGNCPIPG